MSDRRLTRPRTQEEAARFQRDMKATFDELGIDRGHEFLVSALEQSIDRAIDGNEKGPHVAGSETSRKAAWSNYPRSGTQRSLVCAFIERTGGVGATRQEIAENTGLPDDSVRPRVVELMEGGWVRPNGKTRKTHLGEDAEVLVRTSKAADPGVGEVKDGEEYPNFFGVQVDPEHRPGNAILQGDD